MTQTAAAEMVGITRSHFGRMEAGGAKPSTPVAKRLVAVFTELTRDQVLFPEDYVKPPVAAPRMPVQSVRAEA